MNNMKSKIKKKIVIKELKNELKTDLEIYKYEYKENLKKIKVDNLLKLDELATDKLKDIETNNDFLYLLEIINFLYSLKLNTVYILNTKEYNIIDCLSYTEWFLSNVSKTFPLEIKYINLLNLLFNEEFNLNNHVLFIKGDTIENIFNKYNQYKESEITKN
jgi:hypothetical protein